MARIRTIKPELPQDVKLATASREARYTFVLLITQADDEGLIPGAHRQLLGLLYPHDEDVSTAMLLGWIEELVGVGAVRWRSTVDGAPILELTNWSKHQRVDNKGRSQLAGFLAPLAETRREPPRTAATRGLDLGPGTKDQGPSSPPKATAKRAVVPSWSAEGSAWWIANVGAASPGRFGKALSTIVAVHGWPAVFPDLQAWVAERKRAEKPCRVEWYASEASARITAPPPPPMWDAERQCLTDYGERMTRPDRVSA